MIGRRVLIATAAALLAGSVAAAGAAPAAASDSGILVSLDGLHFSQAPEGSLFDPSVRVVPGDHLTGTLWVRNDSPEFTRLTLAVTDTSGSPELLRALTIRHTPNEWLPVVGDSGQCEEMTLGESLDPGATTRVDLALVVDDALAGTAAQNATGAFALRAVLSDPRGPVPDACSSDVVIAGVPGGGPSATAIASTGAAAVGPIVVGSGAVLLGLLLIRARRRRGEDAR